MLLTSITNLKLSKDDFQIIDEMSFRVKSLYNSGLFKLNEHYQKTGKFLGFSELDKMIKSEEQIYRSLPAQVSQQTLKKLCQNFKSFFSLLKKQNYDKPKRPPKYLPKDGRKEIIFQKDSFRIKDDKICLSISPDLKIKFNKKFMCLKIPPYIQNKNIKYIEIIPKLDYYQLSIVYKFEEKEPINEFDKWLSIDIGLNNLLTCTSNVTKAFIINGKPLKSINQKFNKRISKLKSKISKTGKRTSKQIQKLYSKRGNKINNEIHKITNFIVKVVKENNIHKVIIGYNKEWKQDLNLGKRNNQNFTQIPFYKIIQQLQYKLLKEGIELIVVEESYTSKTSALDLEEIKKHETYKGKRVKRGLFKTATGILINADVNGSLNIFRKAISNLNKELQEFLFNIKEIIKLVLNPIKITLQTNTDLITESSLRCLLRPAGSGCVIQP